MLPPANENGDLPPGVHAAHWTEIERRFGSGSPARKRAMATLRHVHELAVRTGCLKNLYVFGSFVSDEPDPRDVDLILIMDGNFKLEDLRDTARPEEWPALSSGYRLEIERMQGEVLDYLVRDNPNAATRSAILDASQTRARYDTSKEMLGAVKGRRGKKKR